MSEEQFKPGQSVRQKNGGDEVGKVISSESESDAEGISIIAPRVRYTVQWKIGPQLLYPSQLEAV